MKRGIASAERVVLAQSVHSVRNFGKAQINDMSTAPGKLGTLAIAFTCYSLVSGGPVGIEDAVGAGGALLSVLAIGAVAVLWSLPQALITAELGTAIQTNGGSIDWVLQAAGFVPGLCNAFSLTFNQIFDLPLYPVLLVASLTQVLDLSSAATIAIRCGVVVISVGVNIVGMDLVSSSATLLTVFILIPFLLLPIVAAAYGSAFTWSAVAPAATPSGANTQLAVIVSGILWNNSGWGSVGNLAAEIADPQRAFPRGVALAVVLVSLSYVYSIVFGAALHPDFSDWEDGYFVEIAKQVVPWLGIWTAIAASISSLSTCLSSLATYSRSLQAVAHAGYIPIPLLARNMSRFNTPVPAILLLGATTAALMFVDLTYLIILDTTFANVSIALTVAAFLLLRRNEPLLLRPFRVPGQWTGAWLAAGPIILLCAFAFYAVSLEYWYALAVPMALNMCIAIVGFLWLRYRPHHHVRSDRPELSALLLVDTPAAPRGKRVAMLPTVGSMEIEYVHPEL